MESEKLQILKHKVLGKFFEAFGNSGKKITASDVLEGLSKKSDIRMISSIPDPSKIVKAKFAQEVLERLEYPAEALLVSNIINNYLHVYPSKSGDNNRAKQVMDALVSVYKAEIELDKSKGMMKK